MKSLAFLIAVVVAFATNTYAQTYTDLVQLGQQMAASRAATLLNITLMDNAGSMVSEAYNEALQQFTEHEEAKEGYSAAEYRTAVNLALVNAYMVYQDGHNIINHQMAGIHNSFVSPGYDIYHRFDPLREFQSEYGSAIMWCDEAQSVIEECNENTHEGDIETIYMAASSALGAINSIRDRINTKVLSLQFTEAGIREVMAEELESFQNF